MINCVVVLFGLRMGCQRGSAWFLGRRWWNPRIMEVWVWVILIWQIFLFLGRWFSILFILKINLERLYWATKAWGIALFSRSPSGEVLFEPLSICIHASLLKLETELLSFSLIDDWLGIGSIANMVPYVYISDTQLCVRDVWRLNGLCTEIPTLRWGIKF